MCRLVTCQLKSIFCLVCLAFSKFATGKGAQPHFCQTKSGSGRSSSTRWAKGSEAAPKAHSTCRKQDRDEYIEYFVDWMIGAGLTGEHDRKTVERLAGRFDIYAGTTPLHPDSLFKGLKAVGIVARLIDISPTDPRFIEAKRRGIVRPRLRMYCFPDVVPDVKTIAQYKAMAA